MNNSLSIISPDVNTGVQRKMKMTDQKEKRKCDRYDLEARVTWSYFNTTHCFNAKLLNYSESGLCFESESKLRPGASIFIRLDRLLTQHSGHKLHEGFRTVTLAESRWCREISASGSYKYLIGIKYYESYD